MVGIEERIKQKAKKELDNQILNQSRSLQDFISNELSGNPKLKDFLESLQILEELLSKELQEKWEQKAIDTFVGYTEPKKKKVIVDDDDDDVYDDDDDDDDDD